MRGKPAASVSGGGSALTPSDGSGGNVQWAKYVTMFLFNTTAILSFYFCPSSLVFWPITSVFKLKTFCLSSSYCVHGTCVCAQLTYVIRHRAPAVSLPAPQPSTAIRSVAPPAKPSPKSGARGGGGGGTSCSYEVV